MRNLIFIVLGILLAGCEIDHGAAIRTVDRPSTSSQASANPQFNTKALPQQAQGGVHGVAPGL